MNDYEIQIIANEYNSQFKITNTNNGNNAILIINKSPTGNCQLSSIKGVGQLLELKLKDNINIIKKCYQLCYYNPFLILIETPNKYTEEIKNTFEIKYKKENEDMTMFLILLNTPR